MNDPRKPANSGETRIGASRPTQGSEPVALRSRVNSLRLRIPASNSGDAATIAQAVASGLAQRVLELGPIPGGTLRVRVATGASIVSAGTLADEVVQRVFEALDSLQEEG